MPQSAFAARKAAAQAQARADLPVIVPPQEEAQQYRSSISNSRRKRKRKTDDSIATTQILSSNSFLGNEDEDIQTACITVETLGKNSVNFHSDLDVSRTEDKSLTSTPTAAPNSIPLNPPPNQLGYKAYWNDAHQDAEIKLPAGQSLAIVGEYDLWLTKGSISVLGAVIHSSSKLYRIHAPETHAIPLIEALTNPFGPSVQNVEFHLRSASSGIRQLRKCNSKFPRIWCDEQDAVASFQIVGTFPCCIQYVNSSS